MKKTFVSMMVPIAVLVFAAAFTSCGTTRGGDGLTLTAAIELAADEMAADLQPGTRVAIVAFESESYNLSDYIMEELTAALFNRGIEIADRQNLPFVFQELDFQMSGLVSDDTAQGVGHFLGAELVITGQLWDLGNVRRLTANAIRVETAMRASVPRHDVRNDRALQSMIAALYGRPMMASTSRFAVTEHTQPQTAGTYLDRGILFASRGEFELAIQDFTEALRLNPNLAAAYILRARALYASVMRVTGIGDGFESVGTVDIVGRQATEEEIRTLNQAIGDFTQAIRLDPHGARAYDGRGRAHLSIGDHGRAIADFTQAIRLDSGFSSAFNSRSIAHSRRGNLDLALADSDQAIRLSPNSSASFNQRGIVHRERGHLDLAIADFTQAIRLDPNNSSAFINRGFAHEDRGDLNLAIADYTQAIQIDPHSLSAFNNRGHLHFAMGNFDLAIADFTRVLQLEPSPSAFYERALAHLRRGNPDLAIADLTQAIRLNPGFVGAYVGRGMTHLNAGNFSLAIADFEAILRLNPNHSGARELLNIAHQLMGQ